MKMFISKRAGYAIHGLVFLATVPAKKQVYFREILKALMNMSKHLSLSEGYVAKIFNDLSRADFVRADKGVSGGYSLSRPAEEITLLQVIEAIDGKFQINTCSLCKEICENQDRCTIFKIFKESYETLIRYFQKNTIADISKDLI